MKKILLTAVMILFAATSLAKTPADKGGQVKAGCLDETLINQKRVKSYLADLASKPKSAERPSLIEVGDCKNDLAVKECKSVMDQAEKLAQSGKADQIKMPEFKFVGTE